MMSKARLVFSKVSNWARDGALHPRTESATRPDEIPSTSTPIRVLLDDVSAVTLF
jgi:hypothetical protein